ncbi:MAG: YggS family pyridoxal phosphate-dependent enzyme [Gemmatimonadales bacterium]|nr:YggS family pyridoxal phosphate-dependent enzyme [Gemmatimonadales bacterium]
MTDGLVVERLARVRERIAAAQERAGLTHPVTIIAVTKGHGPEAVRSAVAAGLIDVGENRVQEALAKQEALGQIGARWHLIGSLQRNKARQAVGRFVAIHSVDRAELAEELARRVAPDQRQRVLVEVNCSGEAQKGGVNPDGARALVDLILARPTLEFGGLMTMAALTDDERIQRAAFARLRGLKETLEQSGIRVDDLSMGMSGDFEAAVTEGATMVRLGTILFGERER